MLAPMSHGTFVVNDFSAPWYRCWPFATLPICSLLSLLFVSVQTQVALVICALDCDRAQPCTGHQIWSQASQVKGPEDGTGGGPEEGTGGVRREGGPGEDGWGPGGEEGCLFFFLPCFFSSMFFSLFFLFLIFFCSFSFCRGLKICFFWASISLRLLLIFLLQKVNFCWLLLWARFSFSSSLFFSPFFVFFLV